MQAWFLLFISALTLPLLSPSDALAEDSPAAGAETIPFTAPRAPILFAPLVCPEGSKLVGKVPPAALEQGCEAELSSGVKVRRGPWREWYADGTLASAGDYLDGEMQGDWVRYHPNGLLSASGAYLRGQEHGLWATYNSAGRLIQAGSFSRAEKVGAWKSWYENGAVMEAGSYLGGLREGRWTFYYETGSRKEEGFFAAGQKSGRWTRWDAAGRKVEEGQYHLDEKVGPWTTWHGDSALVEAVTVKPEEIAPPSPDPSRDGILGTDGKALLLSDIQRDAAEEMGVIGEQELKGLKPSLWRLPPNPKSTTDFTAYTLEAGEFKIGLLSIGVGIFDNFQMSTMPTLWLAGLPNLVAKVDAIQEGPLDVALQVSRYWLTQDAFRASYTGVGGIASLSVLKYWGVHAGLTYAGIAAQGQPDICALSSFIQDAECSDTGASSGTHASSPLSAEGNDIYGEVITMRAATDIRFNRRDSLILQGSAVSWARVHKDPTVTIPHIAELDKVLSYQGSVPLDESYTASIAWQFAWKNAHLRLGWGVSVIPYAFLTQAAELSIRFGGHARGEQARRYKTWQRNREAVQGSQDADNPTREAEPQKENP